MATKFLDYTGLSYLWGKIKAWCNATFVHLTTDEDITGTKTFVGSKKIAFKQSGSNDKLGFTLYNNSSKEQGYLEYNPTNKIANVPLFTLGNYATAANELTYVGFRRYSNISGASGAYNLLAPLISDAKTPFNLTTTYTNFYLPLGISNGTNIVKASNSGVIDISSFLTLSGYTKPSTGSALATTDTIIEALGKLEVKVDAVDQSNVVHRTGDETIDGSKSFSSVISGSVNGSAGSLDNSVPFNGMRLYHRAGQLPIGTSDDNTYSGSSNNYKLWSFPTNGTVSDSTVANIQDLRFVWNGDYFSDIFISPNNHYLWHRDVAAGVAYGWRRLVEENVSGITAPDWNINIAGNAATATALANDSDYVHKADLANYLTKLTNVSEMGRYIDMHYDNATATNDYDVRLEANSLGSSSGKGSLTITCDNIFYKSVSPAFIMTDTDGDVTTKTNSHWGCVYGRDKNGKDFGRFYFDTYNTSGTTPEFITGLTVNSGGSNNTMCSLALRAQWNATVGYSFGPWGASANSNIRLGEQNRKWKEVWVVATSINSSSDERIKSEVVDIPDEVLTAWEDAKWIRFKYNDAIDEKGIENARYHTGMIAQQIQRVFQAKNINIDKYGFFLYDKWEGQEATYDDDGNERTPYEPAGDGYGLRYTEALCIEAAYQRRKNKILENRISELERQVSDMLQILQSLKGAN